MIAGRGTPDQAPARLFAYRYPQAFADVDRYAGRGLGRSYLVAQFGPAPMRCRFSTPGRASCPRTNLSAGACCRRNGSSHGCASRCRAQRSSGFRAARAACCRAMSTGTGVDAVGLDWMIDPAFARDVDPDAVCRCRAISIRSRWSPAAPRSTVRSMQCWKHSAARPFIFNLGHGILPETPIAHVEQMLRRVRG